MSRWSALVSTIFVLFAVNGHVIPDNPYDAFKGQFHTKETCIGILNKDACIPHPKQECSLDPLLIEEIKGYAPVADRIITEVLQGSFKGRAYNELEHLVDTFGPRFSGTSALEEAIDFMLEKMDSISLDNVHGENVAIPQWVRGYEHAEMISPRRKKLTILGLGHSIGTPMNGLEAPILVVRNFTELSDRAGEAQGKIVVYNAEFVDYLTTSEYRKNGAVEAAKVGAVASLVRSVGPLSLNTPHTGGTNYVNGVRKIPAAAITIEDADLFQRLQDKGKSTTVKLIMNDYTLDPAQSRNVVGDIIGREIVDEQVIISAHIDSWDVGVGAMDDGGGVVITMLTGELLKSLGLHPRRTLRTILWTGEEVGLVGAAAYLEKHKMELGNISVLLESDAATFQPLGLGFAGSEAGGCIIREVAKLLTPLNASDYQTFTKISSDVDVFIPHGVPAISLRTNLSRRYWYHHTEADTLTVEDSKELDFCLATWAVSAYVLADISTSIPR